MKSIIICVLVLVLLTLMGSVYGEGAYIQFGGDVHHGTHISKENITRLARGTVKELFTELEDLTGYPKDIIAQRFIKALMFVTDDETIASIREFRGNMTEFNRNMTPSNSTRFIDGQTVVIGRSVIGFGHLAITTLSLHLKSSKICLINQLAPAVLNIFIPMVLGVTEWSVYYFADRLSSLIPSDVLAFTPNFVIRLINAGSSWVCIITTVLCGTITFASLCLGFSYSMAWTTEKDNKANTAELTDLVKGLKAGFDGFRSYGRSPTVPTPNFITPVYPTLPNKVVETDEGVVCPGTSNEAFDAIMAKVRASALAPVASAPYRH